MKMSTLIVAVLSCGTSFAIAAPQCTQQTTRGNWGFTCEGELPAGGASLRSLGTCTASLSVTANKKTVSGTREAIVVVYEGAVDARIGTFRLQADKLSVFDGRNLIVADGNVVFDQGDVIKGLPTNSGGVLACSLKRINLSEDD